MGSDKRPIGANLPVTPHSHPSRLNTTKKEESVRGDQVEGRAFCAFFFFFFFFWHCWVSLQCVTRTVEGGEVLRGHRL